jgi:transcriptional regulator
MEAKFKMGQDERLYDTNAAIAALAGNDPALSDAKTRHNSSRQPEAEIGGIIAPE